MNKNIKKYIYPSITVFVILVIIGAFVFSALFITKSIDAALISEQESQTKDLQIKMQALEAARQKLSLENLDIPINISTTTETTISTTTEEEKIVENKTLLSLAVLNSTGIPGKAGELAKLISTSGFKVSFTGNAKKLEPTTVIQIKETSKKIFPESLKELLSVVRGRYSVTESILEENSEYDAIVIIGTN